MIRLRHLAVFVASVLPSLLLCVSPTRAADSKVTASPEPAEVVSALKALKTADRDGRLKIYDLLAAKGDFRLIRVLEEYKKGSLILKDDRLMIYGERKAVGGKSVLPLIDAFTYESILGADGNPVYHEKQQLSQALRAPRGEEQAALIQVLAALTLVDPDPVKRIAAIRDAGDRAAQGLPNPDDATIFLGQLSTNSAPFGVYLTKSPSASEAPALREVLAVISTASAEKATTLTAPCPSKATAEQIKAALEKVKSLLMASGGDPSLLTAVDGCLANVTNYENSIEKQQSVLAALPKTNAQLKHQLADDPQGPFAPALREATTNIDLVTTTDPAVRIAMIQTLGKLGTSRAANLLEKTSQAAVRTGDKSLQNTVDSALASARRYQTEVHLIQYTFAGLSAGSILVLLALGLSIIFGLMGVINMAQGEFMMVGAFSTLVVSQCFNDYLPAGAYDYYPIVAVPAAFLVAGFVGFLVEELVVRHLYRRPLDTLLATWGVGLVLIWAVRGKFGDNVSIKPPHWMEGGWEVAPDIVFPLNRVYIIAYCAICIAVVYFVINRTKLGLLLRATTQNRDMAAALGVPTRRVDGLTFAFGAGLAGLAGVAVPMYDTINPEMGSHYIVDCFMVVVSGGVGKLAGAIFAGLGLGFIGKYLEPLLGNIKSLASGASVLSKVFVLAVVILFLQWRPQGLFPPKGRQADA